VADDPFADLIALADLAAASKLPEQEADALAKSLALRPFEAAPVKRLAKLERDSGHAAESVRYYEVICLLEPKNVEAHAALVELALEHGPREVARRYAPRLAELDPGNTVARRALERL
jgi:Tfp pilus assembly protein PilF